jgi:uncharacterized protein
MAGSSRYKTSNYVRTVRGSDERDFRRFGGRIWNASGRTVIYHSLLGNARAVDENVVTTLQRASTEGVSLQQLQAILPDESLRELMTASMLVPEGYDERNDVDNVLAARRMRLPSGGLLTTLQLVLINSCKVTCEYCFAYNADGSVAQSNDEAEEWGYIPRPRMLPLASKPDTRQVGCGLMPGYENESFFDDQQSGVRAMPFSVAARSIRHAVATRKDNGGKELTVHLFGAEPTLHRNLIKQLLAQFRNEYDGVTIQWQITTNGSYLPPDLLRAFAEACVGVEVSVDYLSPETGGYRGGIQQSTPWRLVAANIQRLLDAGLVVSISSVLSADTWDHWNNNIIDFAAEMGIELINVIVAFRQSFFSRHAASAVAEKLLSAYDYARNRGVQLSGYWYHIFLLLVDQQKWETRADYKNCPGAGGMLSIEPTGSVHSCKMTNRYIGELANWFGIFASEEYADYAMRSYRSGSACAGCELEGSCSGDSITTLGRRGEAPVMNRGYCEYIRTVVDGLLSRHMNRAVALTE